MTPDERQAPEWTTLERWLLDRQIATGDVRYQDAATLLMQQRATLVAERQALEALIAKWERIKTAVSPFMEAANCTGNHDPAYTGSHENQQCPVCRALDTRTKPPTGKKS